MSVACYNPKCGDDGVCTLQYIGMCPVSNEIEAYWRARFGASVRERVVMTPEERAAHFSWENGHGRDPFES